ncbi:MAG: FMN-binding protein [Blautia sp.]|nr:FMN-binding protein [Blautia sp.]
MKNQNFYMRVLCLVVIIGAVLFYNSRTQEKEYQTQNEELTKRIDALEKQQQEILTALQENFDAQEKAKAESEKQKTETTKSEENADSTENADGTENTDSTDNIEKPDSADSTDTADQVYKDGTYTGDGQGFGGNIQVQITITDDTLTDIQVVSAEKEDSAYLSQGKAVIDRILEAQSTDVDTVSGATFSSTGILMAVEDALGKAENQ